MKKLIAVLPVLLALSACSRNPDPEYAPDADNAPAEVAEVAVQAEVAPPAADPAPAVALTPNVAEERATTLGREAVAMLNENRMVELWPRFDAQVQSRAGSPESFGDMVIQIFGQTGPETALVSETIMVPPEAPELTIYRRRSHYLLTGEMDIDLHVVFNADESIAGVTIRPAEE